MQEKQQSFREIYRAERRLSRLPWPIDCPPPGPNQASATALSGLPSYYGYIQLTWSQTYAVSVTMKNIGTTTWTSAAGYRLGSTSPQDNTNWGIGRVNLPDGTSVAPEASFTFTFSVTAPAGRGIYNSC